MTSYSNRAKVRAQSIGNQNELAAEILIGNRKRKVNKMNNENYYEILKANYPTFNATLRLDERQQKSLKSLLGYTEGALSSYRSEALKLKEDTSRSDDFKQKQLSEAKAKMQKTLDNEFKHIENRVIDAQNVLYAATHPAKPKDTTEALLRFLQEQEIRTGLAAMLLAKRLEILLSTCKRGNATVLRAVESQPVISDLVPSDVVDRANHAYASQVAPVQAEALNLAKQDLAGAEAIRSLTRVELGYIESN